MSTLGELAVTISSLASQVDQLLAKHGQPSPTFDESGAVNVSDVRMDDKELADTRNELINKAHDLIRLAQGPIEHAVTLSYAGIDTANLATILRTNIARAVPRNSKISLDDLTLKVGLQKDLLARIVRYGVMNGIFIETDDGWIGHTAASATLAANKNLHDFALFNASMITKLCGGINYWMEGQIEHDGGESIRQFPDSPFNSAYPDSLNFFDYLQTHPDDSREYYNFLDGRAELPRYHIDKVAYNWPWQEKLDDGIMVDMGGSSGHTCVSIAKVAPVAKFVVQDINREGLMIGEAMVKENSWIQDRIGFQVHDFFGPQSLEADIYFLRHILHDWPDAECIKIIKNLEPVMRKGVKVLINELLIPEPPSKRSILLDDKQARFDDHVMMGAHLACERSIDDFRTIFQAADTRWKYVGTTTVGSGASFSLIEHEWDP